MRKKCLAYGKEENKVNLRWKIMIERCLNRQVKTITKLTNYLKKIHWILFNLKEITFVSKVGEFIFIHRCSRGRVKKQTDSIFLVSTSLIVRVRRSRITVFILKSGDLFSSYFLIYRLPNLKCTSKIKKQPLGRFFGLRTLILLLHAWRSKTGP
jgi:hypothetical protein